MKWRSPALVPVLICAGVAIVVSILAILTETEPRFTFFRRIEWMTYDWRARIAAAKSPAVATNLGFVAITDDTLRAVLSGAQLPYRFGLQWPRQVHARLVNELRQQGAKAVGFDVVFAELRPDQPNIMISNKVMSSDMFFAQQLRDAGNVILPAEHGLIPETLFRTNAWAVADISTRREVDGSLRRVKPFTDVRGWHPFIKELAWLYAADLTRAQITNNQIILTTREDGLQIIPLVESNRFDAVAVGNRVIERNTGSPTPARSPVFQSAFTDMRLWQIGITLAARELSLDLDHASVDHVRNEISIPAPNGTRRVIPLDHDGMMYIDWSITPTNPKLTKESFESLLDQYEARRDGRSEDVTNRWRDKLVVIGVTATGNDLSDVGATPLEAETALVSQHWNVANSVLMNRFIQPPSIGSTLAMILFFTVFAGVCTWNLRTLNSVVTIAVVGCGYIALACWLFNERRVFLPIVLPIGGALLTTHVALIVHMVRVEQRERQRTRDIFGKIVSPAVVRELLGREKLLLTGERRRMTVFFADIRGFTDMTDVSQKRAAAYVAQHGLTGEAAEKRFDAEAELMLQTVNPYLSCIADVIKQHNGTLDKYIGDCVMAFWGAPVENSRHALDCVRAVIDAQRAVLKLTQQRELENAPRLEENARRAERGEPPLPILGTLSLGSGVNTGFMTVGTVGSEQHIMNYTVFGREVNLASRLESASGRARILISEETYRDLMRDDPNLAAACVAQPPLTLKGFADAVRCYEVPWRPAAVETEQRSDASISVGN